MLRTWGPVSNWEHVSVGIPVVGLGGGVTCACDEHAGTTCGCSS